MRISVVRNFCRLAFLLLSFSSAVGADDQTIEECAYWRLGSDEADKSRRLAACDRIISDKRFASSERAKAYAKRADAKSSTDGPGAIADFDRALELDPDQIGWRRDRAYLLHFAKQHDRAIEDFNAILAAKPDGHVMFYRGLTYLGKGDETRGFADLGEGIKLAPDDAWFRYWRARLYAERGNIEAAMADVDASIALKNDDDDAYLLRADLYTKKGETEEAIADLTRAADLNPTYTIPYSNRALLYEQTKQYDLAFADYDKLLSLSPGDAYYTKRKTALLEKLAREPPLVVPSPGAPPAELPSVTAPEPPAAVQKVEPPPEKLTEPAPIPERPATAGKGECRRFDAIANMTISVACPE